MKDNRFLKLMGLLLIVSSVSAVTHVTIDKVKEKSSDQWMSAGDQIPAGYAALKNAPRALDTDFTIAAELTVNSVVHVKTKSPAEQMSFSGDPFFEYFFGRPQFRQEQAPMREGSGSGVIISADGYIVTNNHVIDKSKEIEVVLNDKRTYSAKVIGSDPNTDIALIKIEENNLPVVVFGNSDSVKIGEWVLAVGNPFNLTSTVTAGIVSAKARNINILNSAMKIESFIQTDAAVNPGNSGGALVNTRGELIGINTAIASQTGTYAGYAFAVPSSIVQKVVSDIRQYGVVQRAVLGVEIGDITSELAKEKKLKTLEGAYVGKVVEDGAAAKAGIKEGDVINKVNDVVVKSVAQLQEQIGRYNPGDKVTIEFVRGNETEKVKVELKNRQGNTGLVSSDAGIEKLGATFKSAEKEIKEKLGINYGVEVKTVSDGLLRGAGIRAGYIILKINNQAVSAEKEVKEIVENIINSGEQNKVLFITGVYPNGKVTYYAVDLAQ